MSENGVLLERTRAGDREAEAELLRENMGLVINAAKRFLNRGCDFEELTQVGAVGLLKAARRFDPEFGVCFSTYAVPMIIGELRRFLRDDGLIKVSRGIKERVARGRSAEQQLRLRLMREPTVGEIAAEAGLSTEELLEAYNAAEMTEPIYYENDDGAARDRLRAPGGEEEIINRVTVLQMLDRLTPRERQIMVMRYFYDKTQSEAAKVIGVSQVQISRIEKGVLKKLRAMFT